MAKRIVNALVYTAVAVIGALQVGVPSGWEAWAGVAVLAITTFWGKFSSEQNLLMPNRVVIQK